MYTFNRRKIPKLEIHLSGIFQWWGFSEVPLMGIFFQRFYFRGFLFHDSPCFVIATIPRLGGTHFPARSILTKIFLNNFLFSPKYLYYNPFNQSFHSKVFAGSTYFLTWFFTANQDTFLINVQVSDSVPSLGALKMYIICFVTYTSWFFL